MWFHQSITLTLKYQNFYILHDAVALWWRKNILGGRDILAFARVLAKVVPTMCMWLLMNAKTVWELNLIFCNSISETLNNVHVIADEGKTLVKSPTWSFVTVSVELANNAHVIADEGKLFGCAVLGFASTEAVALFTVYYLLIVLLWMILFSFSTIISIIISI